jgi:hypothetical protein
MSGLRGRPLEYGLIAEEVAEVFHDLVVYKGGEPFAVKYHILSSREEERAQGMEDLRQSFASLEAQVAEVSLLGQPR